MFWVCSPRIICLDISYKEQFDLNNLETTGLHTHRASRCRQYMTGICFPHLPATELAPALLTVTELDPAILA